jgi:hypothetical protein
LVEYYGIFPEDQYDYSPEAEEYRRELRAEYEYYLKHKLPDKIAECYNNWVSRQKIFPEEIQCEYIPDIIEQFIKEK